MVYFLDMEPKFQTTFIPRKSVVDVAFSRRSTVGVFTLITIALFVVTVVLAGGLFVYKQTLSKINTDLKAELDGYNTQTRAPEVGELIALNNRLNVAYASLADHIALSRVFDILNQVTLQDIRWNNFSFEMSDAGVPTLKMSGQARSFAAVALQADKVSEFAINNVPVFKNPIFADFSVDNVGNPTFSLKSELDKKFVLFVNKVPPAAN